LVPISKINAGIKGSMKKLLQYILPFDLPDRFPDVSTYHLYKKWDKPARQIQIAAITFLTGLLYIVFSFLDKSWASDTVQTVMIQIHLILVVPLLFTISFLAYKKRFYSLVIKLLMFFPVASIIGHVYILSQLENYAPFITEGYLAVFWIFVVSGLSFRNALVCALLTAFILIGSGFFMINDKDIYLMHLFWIFCSFSFGFLGAYIFDKSRRAVFMSQQKLHHLAITDELTGTYNRNHLNIVFRQLLEKAVVSDEIFALLIVDLDYFKNINDTFGHAKGDDVLQNVAQVLSGSINTYDTLVRWGGEEFVIIVDDMDKKGMISYCEKINKKIEENNYEVDLPVTASIGATLFQKQDTQDSMISRADKALYQAKGKGRNSYIIAD
jgi:diguanylate cyclase (GGDEF)-like protein